MTLKIFIEKILIISPYLFEYGLDRVVSIFQKFCGNSQALGQLNLLEGFSGLLLQKCAQIFRMITKGFGCLCQCAVGIVTLNIVKNVDSILYLAG